MFLVLTRDFQLSTTITLGRFHLSTFEHRFRIARLLYPATCSLTTLSTLGIRAPLFVDDIVGVYPTEEGQLPQEPSCPER